MPPDRRIAQVTDNPELYAILVGHAYRGIRVQLLLRAVLVLFVTLTITFIPPADDRSICYLIVVAYAVGAVAVAWWSARGGPGPVRLIWVALFFDLLVLTALTLVAGVSAEQSWTSYVLVHGFFLIPLFAASQLRPGVCAAIMVPTVVVYVGASIATRAANEEPWGSLLLRSFVLVGAGLACVALSYVQRSRVLTIAEPAGDRSRLVTELITLEDRERRELSEALHDGALQYVLAARMDLDDLRDTADTDSVERLDHALSESAKLLRSTVTELHPAVLAQAGLARALDDLTRSLTGRGGLVPTLVTDRWPDDLRTAVDPVLYAAARELLTNVVKHASATAVRVDLDIVGAVAVLRVTDDGVGVPTGALGEKLKAGHIGLASQRTRIEAAGGGLDVLGVRPHGTEATVRLPLRSSLGDSLRVRAPTRRDDHNCGQLGGVGRSAAWRGPAQRTAGGG